VTRHLKARSHHQAVLLHLEEDKFKLAQVTIYSKR
jgi:hypothetical protein